MIHRPHKNPARVAIVPGDDFACGTWRLQQPYRAIQDSVFQIFFPSRPIEYAEVDVVIVQRFYTMDEFKILRKIQNSGIKVIIDYDDLLFLDPLAYGFDAPASFKEFEDHMRSCIIAADAVSVSTPELHIKVLELNQNSYLLPNSLNIKQLHEIGNLARVSEQTTLFWAGWTSHRENLELIREPVSRILSQRSDTILVLCGPDDFPDMFANPGTTRKIIHISKLPFETFLRLSSVADINLAPLLPSPINDAKSEIRLLQAGAWGVPSIASPAAPYRRFAQHWTGSGEACLIVEDNSPEGWYQAIRKLVENRALRQAMGRRAQQVVKSKYDLDKINRLRIQMLHSVLQGSRSPA